MPGLGSGRPRARRAVERVVVAGFAGDVGFTRCCVASIRRWYPRIPISLVKDHSAGSYDTSELEHRWGVELWPTGEGIHGWGLSKLVPLLHPSNERVLLLDSDTILLGPVLARLEARSEDLVVDTIASPAPEVEAHYFDLGRLRELDPAYRFPGVVFNSGQLVVQTGVLSDGDLAPLVDRTTAPWQLSRPDVFRCADQGILNYLFAKKQAAGELTIGSEHFMWWTGAMCEGTVSEADVADGRWPVVAHWIGRKPPLLEENRQAHILAFYAARYARGPLPRGRSWWDRASSRARRGARGAARSRS